MHEKPTQTTFLPQKAPLRVNVPGMRGRGATARVEFTIKLDSPNPMGRYEMTVSYRPLAAWTEPRVDQAIDLLRLYFQRIGGFRVADDRAVHRTYDALGHYSVDEIKGAIEAKRTSLGGEPAVISRKACFITNPGKFFDIRESHLETYSAASAAGQARAEKALGQEKRKKAAQRSEAAMKRAQEPPSPEVAARWEKNRQRKEQEAAEQRKRDEAAIAQRHADPLLQAQREEYERKVAAARAKTEGGH